MRKGAGVRWKACEERGGEIELSAEPYILPLNTELHGGYGKLVKKGAGVRWKAYEERGGGQMQSLVKRGPGKRSAWNPLFHHSTQNPMVA